MFHRLLNKYHIVVRRGEALKVLFVLALNSIRRLRLRIYKLLHGIRRPIVHYYALCYNEERLLPFVLDHYGAIADRLTFYDNGSTDSSPSLILARPGTRIIPYDTGGTINDFAYLRIKNSCWKRSRGRADYVVVCDLDELLYHPHLESFLREASSAGISLPTPEGYTMYSRQFPAYEASVPITAQVRTGLPDPSESKCILFDPHSIVDINYDAGAHQCHPTGRIVRGLPYKVLHYRFLDIEAVIARTHMAAARLSDDNRRLKLGYAYLYPDSQIRAQFEEDMQKATDIVTS